MKEASFCFWIICIFKIYNELNAQVGWMFQVEVIYLQNETS